MWQHFGRWLVFGTLAVSVLVSAAAGGEPPVPVRLGCQLRTFGQGIYKDREQFEDVGRAARFLDQVGGAFIVFSGQRVPLGQGRMDIPAVADAVTRAGAIRWIILEEESAESDGRSLAADGLAVLRRAFPVPSTRESRAP